MTRILLTGAVLLLAVPALAQDFGWIGLRIDDQADRGAIVRRVEPNSPAEKAGLREGDIVVEFNRTEVIGAQQLTRLVRETPVGRTVDMKVRRTNREETLKITSERAAGINSGQFAFDFNLPDIQLRTADRVVRSLPRVRINTVMVMSGIHVQDLTDQLGDFFGVAGNNGVLVTSVDVGSAADKSGVKAGDVITAIDGRAVRTPSDFSREMRANSRPMLKVFRAKKQMEVRIE